MWMFTRYWNLYFFNVYFIENHEMTRSIFLKNESYNDVMQALCKADTMLERKRLIWERMKANGCTQESEIRFRQHCANIGFILTSEGGKEKTLGKNTEGRTRARYLADAVRSEIRQSKITRSEVEE